MREPLLDSPVVAVVSPYHLTTREAPALAAMLFADRVVTIRPTPLGGESRSEVGRAMDLAPWFLRLLDSWRWSSVLWRSGVVSAEFGGEGPVDSFREVCEELAGSERLRSLRGFVHKELFDDERGHLEVICRDLLRGGPDPGVSLPTAAAVDRFAGRHGLWAVRAGGGSSAAQRAEALMGRVVFEVALPALTQASGLRLLEAREELGAELSALRLSMSGMLRDGVGGVGSGEGMAGLREAARRYAARFESLRDGLTFGDDEDGQRVAAGWLTLTVSSMPMDAVWRSSLAALGKFPGGSAPGTGGVNGSGGETGRFIALTVRTMTISPDLRSASAPESESAASADVAAV